MPFLDPYVAGLFLRKYFCPGQREFCFYPAESGKLLEND